MSFTPAEQAPTLPGVGALPEPSNLAVAARVAQLLLAEHERVDHTDVFALNRAHGALTEALRLVLRAVGAEPLRPAVADLHRQCRDDYTSNAHRRARHHRDDAHLIETAEDTAQASVDRAFPAVAAFLAADRARRGEGQ